MIYKKQLSGRQQVDNLIELLLLCWHDSNRETRREILTLVSAMSEWERLPKIDPNSHIFTIAKKLLNEESVTPRNNGKNRKKRGYWAKSRPQGVPKVFGYRKKKKKNRRIYTDIKTKWGGFENW